MANGKEEKGSELACPLPCLLWIGEGAKGNQEKTGMEQLERIQYEKRSLKKRMREKGGNKKANLGSVQGAGLIGPERRRKRRGRSGQRRRLEGGNGKWGKVLMGRGRGKWKGGKEGRGRGRRGQRRREGKGPRHCLCLCLWQQHINKFVGTREGWSGGEEMDWPRE